MSGVAAAAAAASASSSSPPTAPVALAVLDGNSLDTAAAGGTKRDPKTPTYRDRRTSSFSARNNFMALPSDDAGSSVLAAMAPSSSSPPLSPSSASSTSRLPRTRQRTREGGSFLHFDDPNTPTSSYDAWGNSEDAELPSTAVKDQRRLRVASGAYEAGLSQPQTANGKVTLDSLTSMQTSPRNSQSAAAGLGIGASGSAAERLRRVLAREEDAAVARSDPVTGSEREDWDTIPHSNGRAIQGRTASPSTFLGSDAASPPRLSEPRGLRLDRQMSRDGLAASAASAAGAAALTSPSSQHKRKPESTGPSNPSIPSRESIISSSLTHTLPKAGNAADPASPSTKRISRMAQLQYKPAGGLSVATDFSSARRPVEPPEVARQRPWSYKTNSRSFSVEPTDLAERSVSGRIEEDSQQAKPAMELNEDPSASNSAILPPRVSKRSTSGKSRKSRSSEQWLKPDVPVRASSKDTPDPVRPNQLSDEEIARLGAIDGQDPQSLLPANGSRLSSKNVLTIALAKAQSAVNFDSSDQVDAAIQSYQQAIRLLQEVMERIAPRSTSKKKSTREEERRRLKVIHDTYSDRIALLSSIHNVPTADASAAAPAAVSPRDGEPKVSQSKAPTIPIRADRDVTPLIPPRIAIEPETAEDIPQRAQSRRRDGVLSESLGLLADSTPLSSSAPESSVIATEHRRSDSGESFRSMKSARLSPSANHVTEDTSVLSTDVAAGRLQAPAADPKALLGGDLRSAARSSGDIIPRPTTPYFDAPAFAPTGVTSPQSALQPSKGSARPSEQIVQTDPPPVRPEPSSADSSAQSRAVPEAPPLSAPPIQRPFQQSTLQGAPIESKELLATPTDRSRAASHAMSVTSSLASLREYAVSPSQLSPDPAKSPIDSSELWGVRGGDPATQSPAPSQTAMQQRKRATTMVNGGRAPFSRVQSDSAASLPLVNPSTRQGTISQRRKGGQTLSVAEEVAISENLDEDRGEAPLSIRAIASNSNGTGASTGASSEAAADLPDFSRGFRKRALSQPGRRPNFIGTLFGGTGSAAAGVKADDPGSARDSAIPPKPTSDIPPVPHLGKKRSTPLLSLTSMVPTERTPSNSEMPRSNAQPLRHIQTTQSPQQRAMRYPSPAPSASSGYHAIPLSAMRSPSAPYSAGLQQPSALAELFPSGLASTSVLGAPTYNIVLANSSPQLLAVAPLLRPTYPAESQPLPPSSRPLSPGSMRSFRCLQPFAKVRALHNSLTALDNGRVTYLSSKLCLGTNQWVHAASARLPMLETKVRLMDLIVAGIDSVDRSGAHLLNPSSGVGSQPGLVAAQGSSFVKQLEEFQALLIEAQNTLAKKLGQDIVEPVAGAKKSVSGFGGFGSKLSRSLDRMASGVVNSADDATSSTSAVTGAYLESLAHLCSRSGILEAHLAACLQSQSHSPTSANMSLVKSLSLSPNEVATESYSILPNEIRRAIEAKLRKSSDFFANVLIRFVSKDLEVLLDKSVKRSSVGILD